MKRLIYILIILNAVAAFAGVKSLSGGQIVFWEDKTEVIKYNTYRVEVRLNEPSKENIIGSVTLDCFGSVYHPDNNLFIPAGELKGYVDFSNLENGYRYNVRVVIRNK